MGEWHGDAGRLYVCGWEERPDGSVEGWWLKRPHVRVRLDDANKIESKLVAALTDAIAEETGDMEPAIEFEPPLIKSGIVPEAYFSGGHMKLGSNDSTWESERCGPELFEHGECPECHKGIGPRSNKLLEVDPAMAGHWVWTYRHVRRHLTMVTDHMLEIMASEDRAQFECRRVLRPKRAKKAFYEIIPKTFIDTVALKGLPVTGGTCRKCGQSGFSHFPVLDIMTEFIVAPEKGLPSVFFVGRSHRYTFCLRGDRVKALKPALRALGVSFDPIGAVPSDAVDTAPEIKPYISGGGVSRSG